MQQLQFDRIQSVLCLGAHADDIEIGCGGTILQWIHRHPELKVHWVVMSGNVERRAEAEASAQAFLSRSQNRHIEIHDFRDAYFPAQWEAIKDRFAELSRRCDPDLVLTHRLEDRHQDHRTISELTWNHFRRHVVLEYEIPKFEGDLTTPNVYVPLDSEHAIRKVALLQEHFATQQSKPWYDAATFQSLMRIRGLESGARSQLAEGFFARKISLEI